MGEATTPVTPPYHEEIIPKEELALESDFLSRSPIDWIDVDEFGFQVVAAVFFVGAGKD
jgi:hypothetical protein